MLLIVGAIAAANAAGYHAGRWYSARASNGDERSAEFTRTAIWGGVEFASSADALRSGAVTVVGGGAVVDLRGAVPDPDGCVIELSVTFGGATVAVGADWRVVVDEDPVLSGIAVNVAGAADLPADAPEVRILARGRASGIAIRAGAPR